MAKLWVFLSSLALIIISSPGVVHSETSFTLLNQCKYTIWPGLFSGDGRPQLPTTGFVLQSGESKPIKVPTSWSGRLWARTLCSLDPTGRLTCVTGDCSSGNLQCSGTGAAPPASLAEFTLNGDGGLDFYDVSLVDGYNIPMSIQPRGGTFGDCTATGCATDLNGACPAELQVAAANGTVACKSACEAFGDPVYCCSGAYATPETCKPNTYSQYFKRGCPQAYSYAYDDGTSTFTCGSPPNYLITFCPTPAAGQNSSESPPDSTFVLTPSAAVVVTSVTVVNILSILCSLYIFLLLK